MEILHAASVAQLDRLRAALTRAGHARFSDFVNVLAEALDLPIQHAHGFEADRDSSANDVLTQRALELFEEVDVHGRGAVTWDDVSSALLARASGFGYSGAAGSRSPSPTRTAVGSSAGSNTATERRGHMLLHRADFDVRSGNPFASCTIIQAHSYPAFGAVLVCFKAQPFVALYRLYGHTTARTGGLLYAGCFNVRMPPATHPREHATGDAAKWETRSCAHALDAVYMRRARCIAIAGDDLTITIWDARRVAAILRDDGSGDAALAHKVMHAYAHAHSGPAAVAAGVTALKQASFNPPLAAGLAQVHTPAPVHTLAWLPEVCKLIGGTAFGALHIWHVAVAVRRHSVEQPTCHAQYRGLLQVHTQAVRCIEVVSDLGMFVTGGVDGFVALWGVSNMPDGMGGRRGADSASLKLESFRTAGHTAAGIFLMRKLAPFVAGSGIRSLTYLGSARYLLVAAAERSIACYDLTNEQEEPAYYLEGHRAAVECVLSIEPRSADEFDESVDSEVGTDYSILWHNRCVHCGHVVSLDALGELRWWTVSRFAAVLETERCLQVARVPRVADDAFGAPAVLINLRQLSFATLETFYSPRLPLPSLDIDSSRHAPTYSVDTPFRLPEGSVPAHDATTLLERHQEKLQAAAAPYGSPVIYEGAVIAVPGSIMQIVEAVPLHTTHVVASVLLMNAHTGQLIACIGRDMKWYEAKSGTLLHTAIDVLPSAAMPALAVLAERGKRVVVACVGGTIVTASAVNGSNVRVAFRHSSDVTGLDYDEEHGLAISCATDGSVHVWREKASDDDAGELRTPVKAVRSAVHAHGSGMPLSALAFHPQLSIVATGAVDGSVRLWDFQSLQWIGLLQWHDAAISTMHFSTTHAILAVADDNAVVSLWNVPRIGTPRCLCTFRTAGGGWTLTCGTFLTPQEVLAQCQRLLRASSVSLPMFPVSDHRAEDAIVSVRIINSTTGPPSVAVVQRGGVVTWWSIAPLLEPIARRHVALAVQAFCKLHELREGDGSIAEPDGLISGAAESLRTQPVLKTFAGFDPFFVAQVDGTVSVLRPLATAIATVEYMPIEDDLSTDRSYPARSRRRNSRAAASPTSSDRTGRRASLFPSLSPRARQVRSGTASTVSPSAHACAITCRQLMRIRTHGAFELPRDAEGTTVTFAPEHHATSRWVKSTLECAHWCGALGVLFTAGGDGAINAFSGTGIVQGHMSAAAGCWQSTTAKDDIDATSVVVQRDGWAHVCGVRSAWCLRNFAKIPGNPAGVRLPALTLRPTSWLGHARPADGTESTAVAGSRVAKLLSEYSMSRRSGAMEASRDSSHSESEGLESESWIGESSPRAPSVSPLYSTRRSSPSRVPVFDDGGCVRTPRQQMSSARNDSPSRRAKAELLNTALQQADDDRPPEASAAQRMRAVAAVRNGLVMVKIDTGDEHHTVRHKLRSRNPELFRRMEYLQAQAATGGSFTSLSEHDIVRIARGERLEPPSLSTQLQQDERRDVRVARAMALDVISQLLAAGQRAAEQGCDAAPVSVEADPAPPALLPSTLRHIAVAKAASKWVRKTLQNRERRNDAAGAKSPVTEKRVQSTPASPRSPGSPASKTLGRRPSPLDDLPRLTAHQFAELSMKTMVAGVLHRDAIHLRGVLADCGAAETGFVAFKKLMRHMHEVNMPRMRQRVELLFRTADVHGTGQLSVPDFVQLLFPALTPSQHDTLCAFALYDGPDPTTLAKQAVYRRRSTVDTLRELFSLYDRDGSGSIDRDEMVTALKVIRGGAHGITEHEYGTWDDLYAEVDQLISAADASGDGQVDFDEFVTVMAPLLE